MGIHGKAGLLFRRSERFSLACGPRVVGRRQHLEIGVARLVSLDGDVGSFQEQPADLCFAEEK